MEAEPLSESKIHQQSPWTNLDLAVGEIAGVALAAENVVLQRGRKSMSWQMGQLHASYVGFFKKWVYRYTGTTLIQHSPLINHHVSNSIAILNLRCTT